MGETPDYINATIVHVGQSTDTLREYAYCCPLPVQGYKKKTVYFVTQGPMQSTARDFWKMVEDNQCSVLVMLSGLLEGGEVRSQCWQQR